MPYPDGVAQAQWWRYVVTVTGNATQKDIAAATGIDQSSISRWQRGTNTPRAEAVVALARAYRRSPVEALVAADYLSSDELGVVELTTLTGDLSGASIDSLVKRASAPARRRYCPRTRSPGRPAGPPITRQWAGARMSNRAEISAADRSSGRTRDITSEAPTADAARVPLPVRRCRLEIRHRARSPRTELSAVQLRSPPFRFSRLRGGGRESHRLASPAGTGLDSIILCIARQFSQAKRVAWQMLWAHTSTHCS